MDSLDMSWRIAQIPGAIVAMAMGPTTVQAPIPRPAWIRPRYRAPRFQYEKQEMRDPMT